MDSLILGRSWEFCSPSDNARKLSSRMGIPTEVAGYLEFCGLATEEDIRAHLLPELRSMRAPWMMKGMHEAVERLVAAVKARETIGIFGDYDADGVSATSLLALFFRSLDQPHTIYIPHREEDGYGLNLQGLNYLKEKGASLVVTVDCGITAVQEVEDARELGLDLIITDHHEPSDVVPDCIAVIDPKQKDCPYPFKGLAGVGVAFNLIVALRAALREEGFFANRPEPNLRDLLDIVTIGTIGDIVPLLYENRIFTRIGLELIQSSKRPGVQALLEKCSVKGDLSVNEVAFRMVPRINAAGRMDHARIALRLFLSEDWEESLGLADTLNRLNSNRQRIEQTILQEALELAENESHNPILILARPGWKKGVIGIVASKLMDRLGRPTILLTQEPSGILEGSGRSPAEINLLSILKACSDHLDGFGGHSSAAGLRVHPEHLESFKEAAIGYLNGLRQEKRPSLTIHMDLRAEDIVAHPFHEVLQRLEPFGPGFEPPLMRLREFHVRDRSIVGNNHLKLILSAKDAAPWARPLEVLGWGLGSYVDLPWHQLEMACTPFFNYWNGRKSLQLELKDVRYPGDEA